MTNPSELAYNPEAQIAALEMTLKGVADAFECKVSDLESVLPKPEERRQDTILPVMSAEQESAIRYAGDQLGIGSLEDKLGSQSPDLAYVEGGLPHKVFAEATLLRGTEHTAVFAGSADRKLTDSEITFMSDVAGIDMPAEPTEYDMVLAIARSQCDVQEYITALFGYSMEAGFPVVDTPTGQLVKVGVRHSADTDVDTDVLVLRIDREYYDDQATGKRKYRQPDTPAMAGKIATYFATESDVTAILTSTTYPSRGLVKTAQIAQQSNRNIVMSGYGQNTLARVKAGPLGGEYAQPEPVATQQIVGEIVKLSGQLASIK